MKLADGMRNSDVVKTAWSDGGEIIQCDSRKEVVEVSDRYAREHLQVLAEGLDW